MLRFGHLRARAAFGARRAAWACIGWRGAFGEISFYDEIAHSSLKHDLEKMSKRRILHLAQQRIGLRHLARGKTIILSLSRSCPHLRVMRSSIARSCRHRPRPSSSFRTLT